MEKPHLEQTLINPTHEFSVSGFAYAAASSLIIGQALLFKRC
jgi:hypothetical protein